MSGSGLYKIQSLIEGEPYVGVRVPVPPPPIPILSEPVRINAEGIWRLTQQGDSKVYHFAIGFLEHTDLSKNYAPNKNTVIATTGDFEDKLWYVYDVGHGEYIIALANDRLFGWTVYGVDPDAYIVLDPLPLPRVQNENLPNPFYHLFKLTKLEG